MASTMGNFYDQTLHGVIHGLVHGSPMVLVHGTPHGGHTITHRLNGTHHVVTRAKRE